MLRLKGACSVRAKLIFLRVGLSISRGLRVPAVSERAFAAVFVLSLVVKLILSAISPASDDLVRILNGAAQTPWGPWIALYSVMLRFSTFLTGMTPEPALFAASPPWTQPATIELLLAYFRLPLLVLDVAVACLVYLIAKRLSSSIETARVATLLWFINPFALFTIEMLAVPDVATILLTMLATLFLLERRPFFSSIALAAGVFLKLYPILLVPVFIFCIGKSSLRTKLLFVLVVFLGFLGYLAWLFQAGVSETLLVNYTPVSQPITTPAVSAGLPVGFAIITMVVYYYVMWMFSNRGTSAVVSTSAAAFLLSYVLTSPHPQYFLWAIPFLTLELAIVNRRELLYLITLLTIAFVWGFFTFDGYLTLSGYSLVFVQLTGQNLPWYSQIILSFFSTQSSAVLLPLLKAALSAWALIYAAEIIRHWFTSRQGHGSV
jgi:hypothetical protein